MADFQITDALTGDRIEFDYATGNAEMVCASQGEVLQDDLGQVDGTQRATSIFFPGCSFLNYAMPLVAATYDLLQKMGEVDGISVLCCGKILSYEPDGQRLRDAFEENFREHLAATGIKHIVCACPNCVKALREALLLDPRTKDVHIDVLPQALADGGYRLDPSVCARLIKGDASAQVLLCPHDSCPDREYGQFADGLRALLPEGCWVDPAHSRKRSVCCGSLPRAAGKFEQADKCALLNGQEAVDVQADAIVTACMSCTFQLNMAQPLIQCVNYLELLFDWRIDWRTAGAWMKLRFLFNETLGAVEKGGDARAFAGLGAEGQEAHDQTVADGEAHTLKQEGTLSQVDEEAASDVAFSNKDTTVLGEENC